MKIIDILHNIANKGTVPDKIKVFDKEFIYDKELNDYQDEDGDWLFQDYYWLNELNTEVNILAVRFIYNQDKKIKKLSYSEYEKLTNEIDKVCYLIRPINEIIDYIMEVNNDD